MHRFPRSHPSLLVPRWFLRVLQTSYPTSLHAQDRIYIPRKNISMYAMTFGLTNAKEIFNLALNPILSIFSFRICSIYLEDIIMFSNSIEEHLTHLYELLTNLKEAGIALKIRKCTFFTDTVQYLSHVIKPGTLCNDPNTRKEPKKAKPSTKNRTSKLSWTLQLLRRFNECFKHIPTERNRVLAKNTLEKF